MTILSQEIKERFYKTLNGDMSIEDFELWLYADKELEKYLETDDYLELISLNFKKSGAKYEIWNLLKNHIDLGKFETYKMLELLKEAQKKTDRLPEILMEFYDLYCMGYHFLQDLGLEIGLALIVPRIYDTKEYTWDEMTSVQQKELLESFSPKLEKYTEKVIDWLETKKILLTGRQDERSMYTYEDLRTDEERESELWLPWVTITADEIAEFSTNKDILWNKFTNKKW